MQQLQGDIFNELIKEQSMRSRYKLSPLALACGAAFLAIPSSSFAGAIFTTTPDGTVVNENVRYASKFDVYLDGGPQGGSPQTAAGLADGDYFF